MDKSYCAHLDSNSMFVRFKENSSDLIFSCCSNRATDNFGDKECTISCDNRSENIDMKNVLGIGAYGKCNIQCRYCNSSQVEVSSDYYDILEKNILERLDLSKVEKMFCGSGELFCDEGLQSLYKKILAINPNIKVVIETNGIAWDESILDNIGMTSCIDSIQLHCPAYDDESYKKITGFKGGYSLFKEKAKDIFDFSNRYGIEDSVIINILLTQDLNAIKYIKTILEDFKDLKIGVASVFGYGSLSKREQQSLAARFDAPNIEFLFY